MEKINIAEILKDCPNGMELDCTIWNNTAFEEIDGDNIVIFRKSVNSKVYLTQHGEFNSNDGKCVIFPKGKTTWEGFQRPFKDGDILTNKTGKPFILKAYLPEIDNVWSYCGIDNCDVFKKSSNNWTFAKSVRFATEEEKEILFQSIKDRGYKWNAETKTLEKLIEPKFNVGDRVKHSRVKDSNIYRVVGIVNSKYEVTTDNGERGYHIDFETQCDWELVPNKFDFSTFKPFDKVLIRDTKKESWKPSFFGFMTERNYSACANGEWIQCIPFEGNEHLLGKTDDCDEYYKTWE